MSSFFKRQPELFDTKKLGTSHGSGSNLAAAGLAMIADKPASTSPSVATAIEEADSMPESWVELAPSRASLCSSIEAIMVESTSGGDVSVNKDSRLSPVSLQSPHVEFESSLEQVKYRLVKDMLPSGDAAKSTDWLWDWSARSEGTLQKTNRHRSGGQIGSTLTTPPNSPEPESSEFEFKSKSSNRSMKKMAPQSVFTRFEVIFGLVFSNLVTFFVGAAIGFCLSRKISWKSVTDPTEPLALTYYYG